jgi:hypothetical protein
MIKLVVIVIRITFLKMVEITAFVKDVKVLAIVENVVIVVVSIQQTIVLT